MTPADLAGLGPALARWLPSRRWFQGKARELVSAEVVDHARIEVGAGQLVVAITEVSYADGGSERYLTPLVPAEAGPIDSGGGRWDDALAHPGSVRTLARLATQRTEVATADGGVLRGRPVTDVALPDDLSVRPLGVEQTNSSAVLGDAWILKVLRRLESGPHPDVEITAVLTAAGFPHIPAQHGSWVLEAADRTETALAVLADFLAGSDEAWALATAETRRVAAGEPVDEQGLLGAIDPLGEAVAALHTTLADGLGWTPAERADTRAWSQAMLDQLERVLALAAERAAEATVDVRARAGELRATFEELGTLRDAGRVTRIHGDLHLGQVLRTADGSWRLLDFEGEPARPLEERRAPSSPLRDVAGMLRSFDYAAAAPAPDAGTPVPLAQWRETARRRFLSGYIGHAGPLLPGARGSETLLTAFELDKAVYELGYELANRPSWVTIPVGGILRALDAR